MKDINFYSSLFPYKENSFLFSENLESHMPNFEEWINLDLLNKLNIKDKDKDLWTKKEEINSLNYRCQEFTKVHDGTHVVFSGCSNTWGMGLYQYENWAYKTYKKISKENKCSGYFNLAISGSSLQKQIINLFKYFKEYGNPDIIFINFPDLLRFYFYHDSNKKYYDGFYKEKHKELIRLVAFEYYFMLNQYCKTNKIKLYSFSWILSKNNYYHQYEILEVPLENFDSYYSIDEKDLNEYIEKQKDENFLIIARDNEHPGIAYHDYWSNFIYEKYKKDL
jgi:hypothetical protein